MKKYIDVSEHNGDIDWERVKGSIDGAILRAGYGKGNADKKFTRNAAECNRLGIPCGAYWFSYALTPEMAAAEAKALLEAVKPYRMELPLAFDFEYDSVRVAARNGVTITKELASNMVRAFCVFKIFNGSRHWSLRMKSFSDLKSLYCRNKNIYSAVRQVNFLYDSCNSSHAVQICNGRIFCIVFKHYNSDKTVFIKSLFHHFYVVVRINHQRRKNSRKNRASLQRNKSQLIG